MEIGGVVNSASSYKASESQQNGVGEQIQIALLKKVMDNQKNTIQQIVNSANSGNAYAPGKGANLDTRA